MTPPRMEFRAEDFKDAISEILLPSHIASIANSLLPALKKAWMEELMQGAPTVYGHRVSWEVGSWVWDHAKMPQDTHTARLVDIREIITLSDRDRDAMLDALALAEGKEGGK